MSVFDLIRKIKNFLNRQPPCPPGTHLDGSKEKCLPCKTGRYNHGNMFYSREKCYDTYFPPYRYFNATDVICSPGWGGTPFYEHGEYEGGCHDVDPTKQPVKAPTFIPSFTPTLAPINLPQVCIACFDLLTNKTSLPTIMPSVDPSFGPTIMPSGGPTLVPSGGPTLVPSGGSSVVPSFGPTIMPSDCSYVCCWLWVGFYVFLGIAGVVYLCKYRCIRNRPEPLDREVAMIESANLPPNDSLQL